MSVAAWIALFSPAGAVVLLALGGNRIPGRLAGWIASLSALVSFVCSVSRVLAPPRQGRGGAGRADLDALYTWISTGASSPSAPDTFRAGLTISMDPLTVFA